MDALALLCNLHADGPTTLQRLRSAGCDALEGLDALPDAELERALGCGGSRPARFRSEAHLLQRRILAEAALEPEHHAELQPYPGPRGDASGGSPPPHAEGARVLPEEGQPLIDAVLQAWGDGGSPASSAAEPRRPSTDSGLPVPAPPSGTPRSQGVETLEELGLDGLGEPTLRALAKAGVTSVEDLLRAEPLAVSRVSSIPYTALLRLQFLARRAREAARDASHPAAGQPAPEHRSAPLDPPTPELPETAGPFA